LLLLEHIKANYYASILLLKLLLAGHSPPPHPSRHYYPQHSTSSVIEHIFAVNGQGYAEGPLRLPPAIAIIFTPSATGCHWLRYVMVIVHGCYYATDVIVIIRYASYCPYCLCSMLYIITYNLSVTILFI